MHGGALMASMNIYLPDELKERMSKVDANWSELCQEAIENALHQLETGVSESSEMALYRPGTKDQWATIPITQHLKDQGSIVRLPELKTRPQQDVMSLSDWVGRIHTNVSASSAITGRGDKLLDGSYELDLLIPGQPWRCGQMSLDLNFTFHYDPFEDEMLSIHDAK
jgi:hypothetical protein